MLMKVHGSALGTKQTPVNILLLLLLFKFNANYCFFMCFQNWFTLSPTHKSQCHPESGKKCTLSGKQYKLVHIFFFQTKQHDLKTLKEKPEPKQIPSTRQPHTNFLNLGNQTRERERAKRKKPSLPLLHIIYIEFISQTQGAQSEVPWAKFVPC